MTMTKMIFITKDEIKKTFKLIRTILIGLIFIVTLCKIESIREDISEISSSLSELRKEISENPNNTVSQRYWYLKKY